MALPNVSGTASLVDRDPLPSRPARDAVTAAPVVAAVGIGSAAILLGFAIGALAEAGGIDADVAVAFGALGIAAATAWRAARAEMQIERLEAKLLDEHSYQVFIDNALEGFFRSTRDGRYIKVNPALAQIYGYHSPEQLIAEMKDIASGLYVDPERRREFKRIMRSIGHIHDFTSQIRRRDGSVIWISENARTVYDSDGQFLFYEGTVEDITPQHEAAEAMRRALEETQEAARTKAAFLAAMSHELKTPLNAVIGFSDVMRQEMFGPVGEARYAAYIADIHENGCRLLDLINDILDITRIEGKLIGLDEDMVLVEDVLDAARAQAVAGRTDLPQMTVDLPPQLPLLRADPKRLRQILSHLISNAIKFTPPDGHITITVHHRTGERLSIAVADNGIGMEAEQIAHALEPFKQLDNRLSRRFDGAGLGLPLANSLLRLHGGTLGIDSEPGRGTVVTVGFPAERIVEAAA